MTEETMEREESTSTEALLGEAVVTTSRGRTIYIRPWGVKTSRRIVARLRTVLRMMLVARDGGSTLPQLIDSSWDELVGITADSVGLSVEELEDDEQFLLEDLLSMIDAIIRVNFIERPGLAKNLMGLLATLDRLGVGKGADTETEAATAEHSPKPSSS